MEDQEIVQRFLARDEDAIAEIERKYGVMCERMAVGILGNRQEAEECVSDAYLRLWNTIPPEHPRDLKAYLCRILRNLAIDRYRAQQRRAGHHAFDVALDDLAECLPAREDSDEALAANLNAFLDELDELNRNLFLGRYWHAYSVKHLAKAYGMTANCISVRLHRVRAELKEYLTERGYRI